MRFYFLIMSSLEEWKDKLESQLRKLQMKEVLTAIGVMAFMGGSFWLFRHLHFQRSPVTQHIIHISENVQKCWEKSQVGREPLIIEEQHTTESNDIPMIYTLVSKLNLKEKNTEESIRNPFLPPFQQGLYIQELGNTHRLLFNKYNIYQHHLLVTTKEFQLQSNPLNKEDFKQTIYAFKAMKGLYFFNSGPKAGASQKHKHIQIFPHEARDLPIFRHILQFCRQTKHSSEFKVLNTEELPIIQYPPFRFKHGLIIIGTSGSTSESESDRSRQDSVKADNRLSVLKEKSLKAYQRLYSQLLQTQDGEITQYNLIGCEQFLLLVPRRKEKAFDDLSINAVGLMGSVLFKSKQKLKRYMCQQRHGYRMLQDITYAKLLKH